MTSKGLDGECLQLVLPECLRPQVMESLHDCSGHQGRERTVALVSKICYWPGMQADVIKWIERCERCKIAKTPVPTIRPSIVFPSGTYGVECRFKCGQCRDGVACHHVSGTCVSGCEPGYTGQACNKVYPYGQYGDKCEKFCGADAKCNPVTGECCGCTELLKSVKEKDANLDHEEKVVIGLAVPLGVSLLLNCILCSATCYFYIIYKEEIVKKRDERDEKNEHFLN
ncbi:multiple epidermal growth factor-like domains protein 10 [Saccostrea cucullata]|uniref:multiple epidermal growth factor-like domains protein 10 n=1 Tax=Saccostrea cuccullata TaxID=36930 RepID=UPI002ED52033